MATTSMTFSTFLIALCALTITASDVILDNVAQKVNSAANAPGVDPDQLKHQYQYAAPDLSEEESRGSHVPGHLKCDACMATCTLMSKQLARAHGRNPRAQQLPESDLYDALETACDPDSYAQFGIKEVDGRKRLTGPDMPGGSGPGFVVAVGGWKLKLGGMCGSFLGQFEEETIYDTWRRLKTPDALAALLCQNGQYRGFTDTCLSSSRSSDEL